MENEFGKKWKKYFWKKIENGKIWKIYLWTKM